MFVKLFLVVASVALCVVAQSPSQDQITSLPGLPVPVSQLGFNMYSGYLTVDQSHQRNLFYWFVEAASNPASKPVVLWLNGGPGCSSLGGFFGEHGPFAPTFSSNGTLLQLNPSSWNLAANMLYLEAPAGVGFSYSNNPSDYNTGDTQTATDNYHALLQFFQRFPQYAANEFYVSGESYAGHYVPELVNTILIGNSNSSQKINIQGFLAGNAWTHPPLDSWGQINDWYGHNLISDAQLALIQATCTWQDIVTCILHGCGNGNIAQTRLHRSRNLTNAKFRNVPTVSQQCADGINDAMATFSGVDIYQIFDDVCTTGTRGDLANRPNYCIDDDVANYLNQPAVQAAIHAKPTVWMDCSMIVNYDFSGPMSTVLPLYVNFINSTNLRILVFSGDNDAIVPFPGTRSWVNSLGRPVTGQFQQWFTATNGNQVGGMVTYYDRLTFASIRGGSHMAPWNQPERAYHMFSHFLANKPL